MVAERSCTGYMSFLSCSLAKISMVAEPIKSQSLTIESCSLAKISMVAEHTGCRIFQ